MVSRNKNIFIVLGILGAVFIGGIIYFIKFFLGSFSPADITITKNEIFSSNGFINPITIEKLRVDSIGKDQRPIRYTIEHLTTCAIKHVEGKPPVPLESIKLNEPGRYRWSQENVNVAMTHTELWRTRKDSIERILLSMGRETFDICPIQFETNNWYFITFLDPEIVGVYVYIDNKGELRQYVTYSGVSPI